MQYLDQEALSIGRLVVRHLEDFLPDECDISPADTDSPWASDCHDRGAFGTIYHPRLGYEKILDWRVMINCAAAGYEGEHEGWGFGFESSWADGRIGPGGIMYNFSPWVWTRDRGEIRRRLEELRRYAQDFAMEVAAEFEQALDAAG